MRLDANSAECLFSQIKFKENTKTSELDWSSFDLTFSISEQNQLNSQRTAAAGSLSF